MRSFSNILPNFATNLHLLVDSILSQGNQADEIIFRQKFFYLEKM